MKRFLALLLAVVMVLSLLPTAVFADSATAANQDEFNLAVAAANAGDTVEITAAGTYKLPGIPKNITIKGTEGVVFDCVGSGSICSVPNGATFENAVFNMGQGNYHGFQAAGTINMKKCTLNGLFFSYGNMNFTECTFNQEKAEYHMWCYAGNCTYTGCTFNGAGKFLNLYNEGNNKNVAEGVKAPWVVEATGCKFISSKTNKAAFNVKETCGATEMFYNVSISDCTCNENFPEPKEEGALVVIDPLVQVDDRASGKTGINVTLDGEKVYENGEKLEVVSTTITVEAKADAEKGITEDIAKAISENTAVTEKGASNINKVEGVASLYIGDPVATTDQAETATVTKVMFEVELRDGEDKKIAEQPAVPVSFRLPVVVEASKVAVYHSDEIIGYADVKTKNGSRYIDVTGTEFSPYGYEILTGETENPVAAIGTVGYATLAEAFAAVNGQSGDDVVLTVLCSTEEEITASYKFTKNLTVTAGEPVTVDFQNNKSGCCLIPADGTTLTIGEKVSIDNLFSIGADKTSGTTVINGTVAAQYFRAYGPKESDAKATLIVNGLTKTCNEESCFRICQNFDLVINGKLAANADVQAAEATIKGLDLNSAYNEIGNGTISLNNVSASFLRGYGNIHFKLKNSKLDFSKGDFSDFKIDGQFDMDSTSCLKIADNLVIAESGVVNVVPGATIEAPSITNKGEISVDLTGVNGEVLVIDFTGSGDADYGTVVDKNGGDFKTAVKDGDLYITNAAAASVKIGDGTPIKYTSINAALAAAEKAEGDAVITVLDSVTEKITKRYTFRQNVTITADAPVVVDFDNIADTSLGIDVTDGKNLTIGKDITLKGLNFVGLRHANAGSVDVYGKLYVDMLRASSDSLETPSYVYLHEGAEIYEQHTGTFQMNIEGLTDVTIEGTKDSEEPVRIEGAGNKTMTFKNAVFDSSSFWAEEGGSDVLANGSEFTMNMDNSTLISGVRFSINTGKTETAKKFKSVLNMKKSTLDFNKNCAVNFYEGDAVNMDLDSKICVSDNATFSNAGTITVDLTGLTEGSHTVIDWNSKNTPDYGTYKVTGNKDYKLTVNEDNDLVAVPKDYVAQIGDASFETLDEALVAAQGMTGDVTVKLLKDFSEVLTNHAVNGKDGYIFENVNLLITADNSVTVDLTGTNYKAAFVAGPGAVITIGRNVTIQNAGAIGNYHYHEQHRDSFSDDIGKFIIDGKLSAFAVYVDNMLFEITENGQLTDLTQGDKIIKAEGNSTYRITGKQTSASEVVTFDAHHDCTNIGDEFTGVLTLDLTDAAYKTALIGYKYDTDSLNVKLDNSLMKITSGAVIRGTLDMSGNSLIQASGLTVNGAAAIKIGSGIVSTGSVTLADVTVDLTGATEDSYTVVSAKGTGTYSKVTLINNPEKAYVSKVVDGNLVIKLGEPVAAVTVKGGETKNYGRLSSALEAGKAAGSVVTLLKDIDLEGTVWTPVADFKGTFDGAGKTVSNLTVSGVSGNLGLFASVSDAVVKNVTVSGAKITGSGNNAGVIAGNGFRSGFENVAVVDSTVSVDGAYVGGIVGGIYSTVKDSSVTGCTVTGKEQVGGVIGYICGASITGCTVSDTAVEATAERAGVLAGKINVGDTAFMSFVGNTLKGSAKAPDMAGGVTGQLMGAIAGYSIRDNDIDAALTAEATNPIGVLRDGQNAAFTGALAANITANWWEDATLEADSFQYTNVASGVSAQTVYRGAAAIGDKVYKSIAAAVEAAAENDVVTLICDVTLDKAENTESSAVFIDKSLTLDLGGKILTVTAPQDAKEAYGIVVMNETDEIEVTVKNGQIKTTAGAGGIMVRDNANVTLEGLDVDQCGTGKQSNYRYAAVSTGGGGSQDYAKLTIKNGTYSGEYHAVMVKGKTSVIIDGGTFSCKQKANAAGTSGWDSNNNAQTVCNDYGYLEIGGGTFSAAAGDENGFALRNYCANGLISKITAGTFNGQILELYAAGDPARGLEISGGTFTATLIPNNAFAGHLAYYSISGGTFCEDVGEISQRQNSNLKIADGYIVVKNEADSTWTVQKAVAKIASAYYATLEAAIGAAAEGDTVVLLEACAENITLPVGVTFNTDGKQYTGTVTAPDGYVVDENSGVYTVAVPVAQIGETKYPTLAKALAAAKTGETVKLLDSITLTAPLVINKSITLDLNEKTVTAGDQLIYTDGEISATVKNGTVVGSISNGNPVSSSLSPLFPANPANSKLTLDTVILTGASQIYNCGAELTVKDSKADYIQNKENDLTVNGGEIGTVNAAKGKAEFTGEAKIGTLNVSEGAKALISGTEVTFTAINGEKEDISIPAVDEALKEQSEKLTALVGDKSGEETDKAFDDGIKRLEDAAAELPAGKTIMDIIAAIEQAEADAEETVSAAILADAKTEAAAAVEELKNKAVSDEAKALADEALKQIGAAETVEAVNDAIEGLADRMGVEDADLADAKKAAGKAISDAVPADASDETKDLAANAAESLNDLTSVKAVEEAKKTACEAIEDSYNKDVAFAKAEAVKAISDAVPEDASGKTQKLAAEKIEALNSLISVTAVQDAKAKAVKAVENQYALDTAAAEQTGRLTDVCSAFGENLNESQKKTAAQAENEIAALADAGKVTGAVTVKSLTAQMKKIADEAIAEINSSFNDRTDDTSAEIQGVEVEGVKELVDGDTTIIKVTAEKATEKKEINAIEDKAGEFRTVETVEIKVEKSTDSGKSFNEQTDLGASFITVSFSFDRTGKADVKVFFFHGGKALELPEKDNGAKNQAWWRYDGTKKQIILHINQLCTFGVTYQTLADAQEEAIAALEAEAVKAPSELVSEIVASFTAKIKAASGKDAVAAALKEGIKAVQLQQYKDKAIKELSESSDEGVAQKFEEYRKKILEAKTTDKVDEILREAIGDIEFTQSVNKIYAELVKAAEDDDCDAMGRILADARKKLEACGSEAEMLIVKSIALSDIAAHLSNHSIEDTFWGTGGILGFFKALSGVRGLLRQSSVSFLAGILAFIAPLFSFLSNLFK